ncbi:MAG: tetratricopeptide repeat protein [Flavobacteriales bacterium]|nr:tetratricopeptide repeat protein [Flavobacteriales bacterium]
MKPHRLCIRSLLLLALCSLCAASEAQDRQRLTACLDSCKGALLDGTYEEALTHIDAAWQEAVRLSDSLSMADVLVQRSEVRQRLGDFYAAQHDLYAALPIYEQLRNEDGLAKVYNHIGSVHYYDRSFDEAGRFYAMSMAIRQRQGRMPELALLYGNLGSLLEDIGRPDSALSYHRRNLQIRRTIGEPRWIAVCYGNLGACFGKLGQLDSATHYLNASLDLVRKEGDDALTGQTLVMLGRVMLQTGKAKEARALCEESLRLVEPLEALPIQEQCYDCLYQAYSGMHRSSDALTMLERLTAARDSMFGRERAKGLLRLELNYAHEREQLADSLARLEEQHKADIAYEQRLGRERDQKRVFLFSSIGVMILAAALWSRLRYVRRSRNLVQKERDRSDALLLNILPRPIADELKANGRAKAREVEGVSILFTDFHDFTRMSEKLSAHELVAEIDACYSAFDAIMTRYGLEKIKTIGDAYMAAAGLPDPRPKSARDAVLAALEMQDWVRARGIDRMAQGLPCFSMRAGIHTGPVVAGIVGSTKFQYDVWGDTVNTAAHMESAGAVGEVNISEATFDLVQAEEGLAFSPRGRVQAKSKGELAMFFVHRSGAHT